ncbi:MAG TPA: hypothetical protein VIK87_01340 [Sphingomonadales bacterium]
MRMLLAALCLLALPARAEEGGAPQFMPQDDGSLRISIPLTLPTGCHHAGAAQPGAPEGQADIARTVAITIPITVEDGACSQELRDLRIDATVPALPEDAFALVVHELWPDGAGGQRIRATAHPLPARE